MSVRHVIVHDTRIDGCVRPQSETRVVMTNETTPLNVITREIAAFANTLQYSRSSRAAQQQHRPFPVLSLMGHGVSVGEDDQGRDMVLGIGRDCIHSENAQEFGEAIRGCVGEKIRVLGCGVAGTENGRLMCRRIAMAARVNLYASEDTQNFNVYWRGDDPVSESWINFGAWEGGVRVFFPDGMDRLAWRGPPPVSTPDSDETSSGERPEARYCREDWRITPTY